MSEGLALKGQRVTKLKQLAALMERDLLGGFLWLEQVKGVGSGDVAQIVEYEEFNKGEVDAYRGVLDDIAKEVGGRVQHTDITTKDKSLNEGRLSDAQRAALIAALLERAGDSAGGSGADE